MNPTQSWSSFGDLYALRFVGFFLLLIVLPVIFWFMWQEAQTVNDYPKVSCYENTCRFQFENGVTKTLPREEVPFDENGVVIKERVFFTD